MGHFTDEQRRKSVETRRLRRLSAKDNKTRDQILDDQIIEARDNGLSIEQIAKTCHTNTARVKRVVFDGVRKAERISRHHESLLTLSKQGIERVREYVDKGDKDVIMWLLKEVGVVGKEQTSITINAQNAQVNTLSNDALDAARAVANLMNAPPVRRQLQPVTDSIEAEIVTPEEEPNEQPRVNVGQQDDNDGTTR